MMPDTQPAFDRGGGARGVFHRKDNPYSRTDSPERHAAYELGWEKADKELSGASEP